MDRRQRKTRDSIFKAFISILGKKDFNHITVGEIIDIANVGRATFYSHFETKDYLLKELCEELFAHIFESATGTDDHRHLFDCDAPDSVFLHLFQHIKNNDNNITELLSCRNNELFLRYFCDNLKILAESQLEALKLKKPENLPSDFWLNYISSTFVETVRWWCNNKMVESPEVINKYFLTAITL